ncbi:UNVERIFIED_CONTAM: hypothetical protein Scaly_1057300 [Sesamum calycinum]|uniref:Plus3 domain-containing protein n=1 Tax=Sesamum calycinum TaxID=2727403 RepID=A0AAW2QKH1_9LAMI
MAYLTGNILNGLDDMINDNISMTSCVLSLINRDDGYTRVDLPMMNINDEDISLGLALGSKNYGIQTRMNNSSGAGVNANSRLDMAFAASDPLSELVWSPHNVYQIRGNPDDNLAISRLMIDGDDVFTRKATLFGPSQNSPAPDSGINHGHHEGGLNTLATGLLDSKVDMAIDVVDCDEPLAKKLSEALVCSSAYLQNQKEPDDEVTSAVGEVNKIKTKMPCPISAPPLKKMESSAENDLCLLVAEGTCNLSEIEPHREKSSPIEKSPTDCRICLSQEKGKEKALFDGDIYGRSSNDDDDSHESVESCNSAGLLSRGIKRQGYDQGLIVGSKRMKQFQGSSDLTSIVKRDSSFMNWISNMVKGLSSPNKEDSSSLAFTLACTNDVYGKNNQENFMCNEIHDSTNRNTGFKSIFQSLYSRNTNMSEAGMENVDDSIEEPEEVVLADKTSLENLPRSRDGNDDNSCKQIVVSNKEVNPNVVGRLSKPCVFAAGSACAPHASKTDLLGDKASDILVSNRAKDGVIPYDSSGKQMNSTTDRTSVDITLAVYASEKEVQMVTANGETSIDLKSLAKRPHILPSPKCRSSEAIASMFARRLDALRHISSKTINAATCRATCFFCGSAHELRECPQVTETELEDLLAKSNSFERFAESPCLCIRCFELDHWAISCPLASSTKHWRSEQNVSVFSHFTACRLQLHDGNENRSSYHKGDEDQKLVVADRTAVCSKKLLLGSFPSNSTLDMKKCSNKRDSASNEIQRSNSTPVAQSEMFHAVRNLRLSRADILRWMDSDVSLSHLNGFFLRLRLGKLEAGLGGTGYYVACITDVGGIRSSVGSRYVSNHDFLEDEIKAWWCRIVKSGCRLPSVDELNSKLNDRKSLGF